jgi:hypothetical protein
MKVRGRAIFASVLLFLFLGSFFLCTGWSIKARLFPLLIVVVGTGLSVCLLFSEMGRGVSPETEEGKPKKDDPAAAFKPTKPKTTPRSEAIMMLWVSRARKPGDRGNLYRRYLDRNLSYLRRSHEGAPLWRDPRAFLVNGNRLGKKLNWKNCLREVGREADREG